MLINTCVHSEAITDTLTYTQLRDFVRTFLEVTSERLVVCVMTPRCPLIAALMTIHGISESEYSSRVLALSHHAVIGYHGHFFHRPTLSKRYSEAQIRNLGSGLSEALAADLEPIHASHEDVALLDQQFTAELEWFHNLGLKPNYYTAGWWYLPSELPALLSGKGIRYDSSVKVFDPLDTFGMKQEGRDAMRIEGPEEILSIVGLTARPVNLCYWLANARLKMQVSKGVLYLHDFDLPALYSRVVSNVKMLNRLPGVRWLSVR